MSWNHASWFLLSLVTLGCEVLVDVDAQCQRNADCERLFGAGHACRADGVCARDEATTPSRPASLPSRWACVGKPAPRVELDADRSLRVTLAVYDYVGGDALEGVSARACLHSDVPCARSLGDEQVAGADGVIEFELPYGFDGHFELTADGMMPLIMSDGPLTEDGDAHVPMLSQATLSATASAGGERYDAARGCVLLDVVDCAGEPADGVRLEATGMPDNLPFYFNDQLPTRDLSGTLVNPIGVPPEPAALAGFINVPPGFATFRATLEEGGQHLTYITLQVRSQTLTLTRYRPGVP